MTAQGRPTKYNEEVNQAAKDYIDNYEDFGDAFPSVVGMAVAIKIGKSTLYEWAEKDIGDFSDTLDKCLDHQEHITLNKSIQNEFNPTISKLVLANFGYHDKQDINADVVAKEKSRDELEARLRANGINPDKLE